MAQIIPIGQPANDPEREAIAYLRDHLPGDYRVLHGIPRTQRLCDQSRTSQRPPAKPVVDIFGNDTTQAYEVEVK